jgi:hypothetical protein
MRRINKMGKTEEQIEREITKNFPDHETDLSECVNFCESHCARTCDHYGLAYIDGEIEEMECYKPRILCNSPESPNVEKLFETTDYEPTNGVFEEYPYLHNSFNNKTHQDSFKKRGVVK